MFLILVQTYIITSVTMGLAKGRNNKAFIHYAALLELFLCSMNHKNIPSRNNYTQKTQHTLCALYNNKHWRGVILHMG